MAILTQIYSYFMSRGDLGVFVVVLLLAVGILWRTVTKWLTEVVKQNTVAQHDMREAIVETQKNHNQSLTVLAAKIDTSNALQAQIHQSNADFQKTVLTILVKSVPDRSQVEQIDPSATPKYVG